MAQSKLDFAWQTVPKDWRAVLDPVCNQPKWASLKAFINTEIAAGKPICPKAEQWFAALQHTPINTVKAIIIGQDPYPTPGHANGLAFSVNPGVAIPASLRNIFKELVQDTGLDTPQNGDLHPWAHQGVLLLNTTLTNIDGKKNAHKNSPWNWLTDQIIGAINQHCQPSVFMLWGAFANKKTPFISTPHHILSAPHPSPLSAHRGFFGCQHFSKCNQILRQTHRNPINWQLQ